MLETCQSDLSFRVLAREGYRRRDEARDELRERVAGLLAIALIVAIPLCYVMSGSDISLVEVSEAAEPAAGGKTFEPPSANLAAVLNRLEADHLSRSDQRLVQTGLKLKGFNPGPVDGIAGKRTLAALNRYRKSIHLPAALAVNRETADMLLDR